jgi:hypothetical protein
MLTQRVIHFREHTAMALDFKNMRGNVGRLLTAHENLNKKIMEATEKADKAAVHATDFGKLYDTIAKDVEFAATQLGNGGENSEKEKQTTQQS